MTHDQRALLQASAAVPGNGWLHLSDAGFSLADARLLSALACGQVGVCTKTGARTFRINLIGLDALESAVV